MPVKPFKAFRKKKKLTQEEVARASGVSQSAISKGERHGFSLAAAMRLARFYGLPLKKFGAFDPSGPPSKAA